MVLAISGITLFAYSDGFGSASLLGVCLAVLSAVGAALYKVSRLVGGAVFWITWMLSVGVPEKESWRCRSISDVSVSQFSRFVQPASILAYNDYTTSHWSGGI